MKRLIIISAIILGATAAQARMPQASDVSVSDLRIERQGGALDISFTYDLSAMPTGQNIETRLTPVIKGANDSLRLESVTFAGRMRMIQAERTGAVKSGTYYRSGKVTSLPYEASVAWQPWMETADVDLIVENLGCCESRRTLAGRGLARLDMGPRPFDVPLQYITPVEERVKMRSAKGEAYVDFIVNKTDIRPDYRNNPAELAKIRATVDSIKEDPDTKITTLAITGYASPEGSYANNERLAKGRTESLAEYVRRLYTFPRDLMQTSWVAEDWAGLRKRVEQSQGVLANRDAILALIDSDLAPDAKDQRIRADFPKDYQYMLQEWYPALRHSDYTVAFEVRKYTDPAEIAKVFRKNPGKLSLRELFIYAETLDPSSREYADVFETAARMFPQDPVANLNAANSALLQGQDARAAAYLEKAGDSPQADYARGVLAVREGMRARGADDAAKASAEFARGASLFAKAARGGIDVSQAEAALARLQAPEVEIF